MVPGLHGFDLIIILAIALLILGPKKLPEIGSAIAKSLKEYHKSMSEVDAPVEEAVKILPVHDEDARESEPTRTSEDKSGNGSPS